MRYSLQNALQILISISVSRLEKGKVAIIDIRRGVNTFIKAVVKVGVHHCMLHSLKNADSAESDNYN